MSPRYFYEFFPSLAVSSKMELTDFHTNFIGKDKLLFPIDRWFEFFSGTILANIYNRWNGKRYN